MARTLLFDGQVVEGFNGQAEEELHAIANLMQGAREGGAFFFVGALDSGGIGKAPVRGDGLAGPERTHFPGGLVADGDDEVEFGCAGSGELIPTFAAQVFDRIAQVAAPARWRRD